MDNIELIERLQKEIKRIGCDARAESLLSLAFDHELQSDDFIVSCDQLFYREYSRDIVFTEIKEDIRKRALLHVHLSRGGLYDQLPEGLFFQPRQEQKPDYSAADMAADHKTNKKKEEEIRRFFLPFENDFFWQRLQMEKEERRLLEGLQSGMLNDYFARFWGIPAGIPREFVVPLILLMPYAYKIAGNLDLTAQALQHLLQEEVRVRQLPGYVSEPVPVSLGEALLGVDMVCGEAFMEDRPIMEWTIGPLVGSRVQDYLDGGRRHTLINTFMGFFVPVEADVRLNVLLSEQRQHMRLQPGEEPILGYSSVLGE